MKIFQRVSTCSPLSKIIQHSHFTNNIKTIHNSHSYTRFSSFFKFFHTNTLPTLLSNNYSYEILNKPAQNTLRNRLSSIFPPFSNFHKVRKIAGKSRRQQNMSNINEEEEKQLILKWREDRIRRLTDENGWLTLVGLDWLEKGEISKVGSENSSQVLLPPTAPSFVGHFHFKDEKIYFVKAEGVQIRRNGNLIEEDSVEVTTDANGATSDVFKLDNNTNFFVIQRGEKTGVRIKDPNAKARTEFNGIDYFPISIDWRIKARFEKSEQVLKVINALGQTEEMNSPGVLHFTVNGTENTLTPVYEDGEDDLWIIFSDLTCKAPLKLTYGGGRFLYVSKPFEEDGVEYTYIDFNKAYTPPCGFTPYATCPTAPFCNRLK